MNNYPVNPSSSEPPESCREECEELEKGKTVKELYAISDYFRHCADELDEKVDSEITMDDFKEAMKDKEEGMDNDEDEEDED